MTPKNPRFFDSHLIAFICVSFALCASASHAGWSEDFRLTYRGIENAPQINARSDTIHVAWQQLASERYVSYLRSINGGQAWDSLVSLTDYGHRGGNIGLSLSGNGVFIGWSDLNTNPVNHVPNIALAFSPNGDIWSEPSYVYDTIHGVIFSDLGVTRYQDSIFVVYFSDERDSTGFLQFKFIFSSDLGETWSSERTIAHGYNYTNPLQIAKCGGTLYIVWSGDCPPIFYGREVISTISRDGGQTWSEPFLVSSDDPYVAQHSCVVCDEETGNFAVGWMDFALSHGFPGDLFVRLTTDGGISWGEIHHATRHHEVASPQIDIRGDSIWAVWSDRDSQYGNMNYEICFSKSTDLGFSWTPYERLTYAEGWSYAPWISYDSGKLHLVWYDDERPPDYGSDIYYKKWDYEVGIIDTSSILAPPILNAFPNPFNSSVVISYSNLKGGEIGIFDIQGKLIKTFALEGGENGKINWDARDASGETVSSGIYFARARFGSKATRASHKSQAIKLIYLK